MSTVFSKKTTVRYRKYGNELVLKSIVERTTKTMAVLPNGSRFNITTGHSIGDNYLGGSISLWTEEDERLLDAQKSLNEKKALLRGISNIKPQNLSADDVATLKALLNKQKIL